MDDVQAAFYRLRFRIAFLEKKGVEFQDWFARLAARAFGPDFEAVRAYGRRGDLKCDGRRVSTRTVFQCYAPDAMKEGPLNVKIEADFNGACEHRGGEMAEWILVHNDGRGLPASSVQLLGHLRQSHPEVKIEVWTEPALQQLADRLPLAGQQAALLRLGRRKEALVETWFTKNRRPDLGERIAEAFRRRYAQLNDGARSADQVFAHLQQYAGMGGEPARQAAVLAVLSYFFERCDIFEDPEATDDTADQAHSA